MFDRDNMALKLVSQFFEDQYHCAAYCDDDIFNGKWEKERDTSVQWIALFFHNILFFSNLSKYLIFSFFLVRLIMASFSTNVGEHSSCKCVLLFFATIILSQTSIIIIYFFSLTFRMLHSCSILFILLLRMRTLTPCYWISRRMTPLVSLLLQLLAGEFNLVNNAFIALTMFCKFL